MTAAAERRARLTFWRAFAVILVATTAWALAAPLASGPDENAHMVKAAAVVRGQLDGTPSPGGSGSATVDVPWLYGSMMTYPICFAFHGDVPASCAGPAPSGRAAAEVGPASTWVIRNNPAYYAVVGLPTLLPPGTYVLYLMRLVSAVLCSLTLAWSFRLLAELRDGALATIGVMTAVTPMVMSLNATVNPSGLEISAALTLWVALLVLIRSPDPARLPRRVAGIAAVTVALVTSRGLSPLFAAVVLVVATLAVGPWRAFVDVLRDRRTWPWLGAVAAGTTGALAWTLGAGTLEAGGSGHPELGFRSVAARTLVETADYLVVAIGRLGWLDTTLPTAVYVGYGALLGLPVLLALTGSRRAVRSLAVVVAVAVLLPVLVHAWQAHNVGYIWTARYSMPLYVGVCVTAGFLARDALSGTDPAWRRRLLVTTTGTAGVLLTVAFVATLHRFTVGAGGSWSQTFSGPWQPPVPGLVLLAVHVLALTAGGWMLTRRHPSGPEPTPDTEPATDAGVGRAAVT